MFFTFPLYPWTQKKLIDALLSTPGKKVLVFNINVHALALAHRDKEFLSLLENADIVFCDGFWVRKAASWCGLDIGERLTPPDWIDDFFVACAKKKRTVFFLGDTQEVVAAFSAAVQSRHPYLNIMGFHDGFFSDTQKVLITLHSADFVLVGMGMPQQEKFSGKAKTGRFVSVGALFRWYIGKEQRAPQWMCNIGLEGVWRFLHHPLRMFPRYILEPLWFFMRVFYLCIGKRILDMVVALGLLLVLSPLFVLLSLLICFDSSGCIFIRQKRVGRKGKTFVMYKFRTLVPDAKLYMEKSSLPRQQVTGVGKWLRHTGLDELPQLLNVLKGEMSLVGPRPEMEFLAKKYGTREKFRLRVKPGITGMWQVQRMRGKVPSKIDVHYDLDYLRNVSMMTDISVFCQTGYLVLRKLIR